MFCGIVVLTNETSEKQNAYTYFHYNNVYVYELFTSHVDELDK